MTRRDGTIRQREDGRWEARYRAASGRRASVYARTSGEVQEALRKALTHADAGIRPVDGRLTTKAYLEDWIATSVRPRVRATTADSYASIVKLYLVPELGRIPLAKLEPGHVQAMLSRVRSARNGDLSPTTRRYVYAVLRIALGRALKSGLVLRNVATLVDPPAKARHELETLDVGQVGTLLASIRGDRLEALYVAAIGTGLRQGELLGLRWADVDMDAGTLTVRNTLQRVTRKLAEPKTERARRTLTMPGAVVDALRAQRVRQLEERLAAKAWADPELVFASPIGTPLDPRNVTRRFQTAIARAGLPRQRFHDLRHAFATLHLEGGEELAVVSKMLGHANLSTTADVYAHLTTGMHARAAARMDGILRKTAG